MNDLLDSDDDEWMQRELDKSRQPILSPAPPEPQRSSTVKLHDDDDDVVVLLSDDDDDVGVKKDVKKEKNSAGGAAAATTAPWELTSKTSLSPPPPPLQLESSQPSTGKKSASAIASAAVYSCEFCGADLTGKPLEKRLQHLGRHKGSEGAVRRLAGQRAGTLPALFGVEPQGTPGTADRTPRRRDTYTHRQQLDDLCPRTANDEQLMVARALSESLADVPPPPVQQQKPPVQQQKREKPVVARPQVISTKAAPVFMRSALLQQSNAAVRAHSNQASSLWSAAGSASDPPPVAVAPAPPPPSSSPSLTSIVQAAATKGTAEGCKSRERPQMPRFSEISSEDRRAFVDSLVQDSAFVDLFVDALCASEPFRKRLCTALLQQQQPLQPVQQREEPRRNDSDPCIGTGTGLVFTRQQSVPCGALEYSSPPLPVRLTALELRNVRLSPVRIRSARPVEQWSDAEMRIAVKEYGRKPSSRDDMLAFLRAVQAEQGKEAATPIGAGRIDIDARQHSFEEELSACIKGERALYEQILLLKVVQPESVKALAQTRGIKCTLAQVRAFLEKQGVALS